MKDPLHEAKDILLELKFRIDQKMKEYELLETYDISAEQAYSWIYTDPEYCFLMGNEYQTPWPSPTINVKAKALYDKWLKGNRDMRENKYIIKPPSEEETLETYLLGIYNSAYKQKSFTQDMLFSLRSFAHYLRSELPKDQRGIVYTLFPECLEIENGVIFKRKDKKTACPVDIFLLAKIIRELVKKICSEKPNEQCSVETLALCWMCLTSTRRVIPAQLEMIYASPMTSLSERQDEDGIFGKAPHGTYTLPTRSGPMNTFISHHLFRYLQAIGNISKPHGKTILHHDLRSLKRSLSKVIEEIPGCQRLGTITFMTFLSFPHEFQNQRFESIHLSYS